MTKLKSVAAVVALSASLAHAQVASLRPVAADNDPGVGFEPSLVGKWTWGIEIAADGKTGYKVKMNDDEFTLRLVKLNGILVADLGLSKNNGLPAHVFMKIRIEPDQFHVAFLNSKWLAETIQTRGYPRHEVLEEDEGGGGVLLLASPGELRRDLVPYLDDPRAVSDEFTLERAK